MKDAEEWREKATSNDQWMKFDKEYNEAKANFEKA